MARIRTIKPSFFRSRTIDRLTYEQRLTFIGLWTHVDDEGRCEYDPELIKADLWPRSRSVEAVEDDLRAITELSLITHYVLGERSYLQVNGWSEHQRVNRPTPSRVPPLSEGAIAPLTSEYESSVKAHGGLSEDSLPEGKGREGNNYSPVAPATGDIDGETLRLVPPPERSARTVHAYTPEFEAFWKIYPKRNGKRDGKYVASREWARAVRIAPVAVIMAAVKVHARQCGEFPKDAERWLKARGWEDYAAEQAPALSYDQLFTTADAKRAAELIREPWADKSQHPDDTTPRAQFIKATRRQWIADHRDAIEAALTRRAG